MTMKIGVISDTHLHRMTRALSDILERFLGDVDVILHAGDYVSAEVVAFLNAGDFHGVYGNMDPLGVKAMLPGKKVVTLGGFRIGLIHGWGAADGLEERIWPEFEHTDVIVYGHSHRPSNHLREGVLLFNPGTATGVVSSGSRSVGILKIDEDIRGEIIPLDG